MAGRLANMIAVITGAGSGIGRASALEFAREGACVLAADIDERGVQETAEQVRALGSQADHALVDVTRDEQVRAMIERAVERFGRVDVLFNNAGVPQAFTPFESTPDSLFDRIMDVNVRGVFYGCRAVIPHMQRQGGGVILITASTAG